jgi:hypothetical protein
MALKLSFIDFSQKLLTVQNILITDLVKIYSFYLKNVPMRLILN